MAIPLLEGLPRPKRFIANKAYDGMSLRRGLKRQRIKAVIPSLATRTFPLPLDRKASAKRNVIERLWAASRLGDASPPGMAALPATPRSLGAGFISRLARLVAFTFRPNRRVSSRSRVASPDEMQSRSCHRP